MENKKEFQKIFRITRKQNLHVKRKCEECGIKESEYFRRLIDADMGEEVPVKTHEDYMISKNLIYEVNKIGNNINQIVKNTNSHFYNDYEKRKLFAMMEKIKELMWQIVGNVA